MVKPLQMMVNPKALERAPIYWTPEGTIAFNKTKIAVSRCPWMYFINDHSPTKLYTDAFDYGVGGVLFQIVEDVWRPIAFISKSLSATHINWSTIQKEAYAIFYCCQRLDYLIRDRKFTIYTDQMSLTYMIEIPTSMITRWFIAMQELDFTVHFVKGSDNELADALSRLCPNLTQIALPLTITTNHNTSSSSAMSSTMSALMVIEPPTDEQNVYIQMCHNAIVGHNGEDRTLTRLFSLNQVWKNMKQHVHSFIRNCPCCQKLSTIDPKINSKHFSTSTHAIFDTLNVGYVGLVSQTVE